MMSNREAAHRRSRKRKPGPEKQIIEISLRWKLVLDKLKAEQRSVAWLAKRIGRTRQTVSEWRDIPDHLVPAVAKVVDIEQRKLRA